MLLWCISCLKSEFCNQCFGNVASFSIQCYTTFFLLLCFIFFPPSGFFFSQNSFLIASDLFSVLCMVVFGLQQWTEGSKEGKYGLLLQWCGLSADDALGVFKGFSLGIGERPGSSDLVCVDVSRAVKYALLQLLLCIWEFIILFSLRWRLFPSQFLHCQISVNREWYFLLFYFLCLSLSVVESWMMLKAEETLSLDSWPNGRAARASFSLLTCWHALTAGKINVCLCVCVCNR